MTKYAVPKGDVEADGSGRRVRSHGLLSNPLARVIIDTYIPVNSRWDYLSVMRHSSSVSPI